MATAFMLGWPYGFTRIMSSFNWEQNIVNGQDQNDWIGPPHDGNYNTVSPTFGPDGACTNEWVCEHRWRQIYNMVQFRNVVHGRSDYGSAVYGRLKSFGAKLLKFIFYMYYTNSCSIPI